MSKKRVTAAEPDIMPETSTEPTTTATEPDVPQAQDEKPDEQPTDTEEAAPIEDSTPGRTEDEYQDLLSELNEFKDKYLRLSAEFDNYRKRTLREKDALVKTAAARTIERLLPVVDDFDRAVLSARESDSVQALTDGLELIGRNLQRFLKECGVEEIAAVGLELDTDFHDAVTKIQAPEKKLQGKIVEVVRKGYTLNGAVVRHAQVVMGE